MMKNWKSLFVKDTGTETAKESTKEAAKKDTSESLSFPVSNTTSVQSTSGTIAPQPVIDGTVKEVLDLYESGLDSINMPGYDFYDFYNAITSIGDANEHSFQLAYHMAIWHGNTVIAQRVMRDAALYISKLSEG